MTRHVGNRLLQRWVRSAPNRGAFHQVEASANLCAPAAPATSTATPTETPTPQPTPTNTSTPSPTPQLVVIANGAGLGVMVRDAPGGRILHALPEEALIEILPQADSTQTGWLQIRAHFGRVGWVVDRFVATRP